MTGNRRVAAETPASDLVQLADERGDPLNEGAHPLTRALRGEVLIREPMRLLDPPGAPRPVEVSARALRDDEGAPAGAMIAIYERAAPDARLVNYASDIEILTEVSRLLSELHDPDEAAAIICTVATGATGAIVVLLWSESDGGLELRCHEGAVDPDLIADLAARARAGAERARLEARSVLEDDVAVAADPADGETPLGTAWHEPLMASGQMTGVLSILWPGLLEDPERPRSLIGLLAHHTATALERAGLLRRLQEAARTDALTGVANRRVWQESLERELMRVTRAEQSLSLVLIDIDHFKAFNDRYGHPAGDRLLCDAAAAWSEQLRAADLLARMGGEEFAVMLPDTPLEGALAVAQRLRESMPDSQTCSLGVVEWDGVSTVSELYSVADAALYRAKEGGRNRVEVAQPSPALREA